MNSTRIIVLLGSLCLLGPVPSQSPLAQQPGSSARQGVRTELPPPASRVLTDVSTDGVVWAGSDSWKASFATSGVAFLPFLGSDAPRDLPVSFQLRAATVARTSLLGRGAGVDAGVPNAPVLRGDTVSIDRGGLAEQYVLAPAGIEQQFRIGSLPARGELRLEVAVGGEFAVEATADGHRFRHALGSFGYGRAHAIDARGARCEVPVAWTGDALVLTVPSAFVEQALLPLVIDPLIGNVVALPAATRLLRSSCIAYDATMQQYVACYERVWSATDSDVILQRFDANMLPMDTFGVDLSTISWTKCRIADLNAYGTFLTVAESSVGNAGTRWIGGRLLTAATATLGAQFDVSGVANSCTAPDIGGDGNPIAPCWFTVVFEYEYAPGDRDIAVRQVAGNGTVRPNYLSFLANTAQDEHSPAISRTDGWSDFLTQAWMVAWRWNTGGNGITRARSVTWNGVLGVMGQLGPGDTTTGPMRMAVSSPTLQSQGRLWLICDQSVGASNQPVVRGMLTDSQWSSYWPTQILADTPPAAEPAVDSDGVRIALSFTRLRGVAPFNHDVSVRTFGIVPALGWPNGQLTLEDETDLGYQATDELGSAICSTQQDAGARYGVCWSHDLNATTSQIEAACYHGFATAGGIALRATGCGPLMWSVNGDGRIGATTTFTLQNAPGLCGWAIGFPVSVPVPGCAGCTQGTSAVGTMLGAVHDVVVPANAVFVGLTISMQAFAFGPGTCLGSVALSNTADLTIR
jgi:hypothetical protein